VRGRAVAASELLAAQIIEGALDDEALRKGRRTRPNPSGHD
jgi:hypothetical protein